MTFNAARVKVEFYSVHRGYGCLDDPLLDCIL